MKILTLLLALFSFNSYSGFYDEDYFEPIILGGVMAYGAYESNNDGNEVAYAFVAFSLGYYIASETNQYFKYKVNRHYMSELEDEKIKVERYKQYFIERAANGDTTIPYSILTNEETDTQKVNDSVISGSRKWSLEEY